MNKIGFNLLAWSASVSPQLYPHIERLKAIGYDGIEIALANRELNAYRDLARLLGDLNLEVTAVGAASAEANPISPDAGVRRKAVEELKQNIDFAHAAGAKILCGPQHSAFAHFTRNAPQPDEYKWSAEVLHAVGEHAAQADVTLALEALNRFECYLCNTMAQLKMLCDMAGHPNIRAMYDTHHANIEEKSFAGAIDTIAPHLAHVHISENDRGTPGAGHIDFDANFNCLQEIAYQGWYTIEAFTRSDVTFANAINVWREYSDTWEIAEQGYQYIKGKVQ